MRFRTSPATSWERGRELGHGSGGTALEPLQDERLGADEDVEPLDQERLDLLERLVRDFQADEVRRALLHSLDRAERDRVAATGAKSVEVERQRPARFGSGDEVPYERVLVEGVIGRPDHGDCIRALHGCVGRERNRLGRRLRSAVDGDVETVTGRFDEQARGPLTLLRRKEDSLARGTQSEHAVEPA